MTNDTFLFSSNRHPKLSSLPLRQLVRTDIGVRVQDFFPKEDGLVVAKARPPGAPPRIIIGPQGRTTLAYYHDRDDWWVRPEHRLWKGLPEVASLEESLADDQPEVITFAHDGKEYELHKRSKTMSLPRGAITHELCLKHYGLRREDLKSERLEERVLAYLPSLPVTLLLDRSHPRGSELRVAKKDDYVVVWPGRKTSFTIHGHEEEGVHEYRDRRGKRRFFVLETPEGVYELHASEKTVPRLRGAVEGSFPYRSYYASLPKERVNGSHVMDLSPVKGIPRYTPPLAPSVTGHTFRTSVATSRPAP